MARPLSTEAEDAETWINTGCTAEAVFAYSEQSEWIFFRCADEEFDGRDT